MKQLLNTLFYVGLIICGLILILGTFLFLDTIITPSFHKNKFPDNAVARIGPNGVVIYTPRKIDTSTKTEENSTKPDDTEPYFEGTTIPIMTEKDLWVAMMTWHKDPQNC